MNDWNLSRSRFWGTPLPIWRDEEGKTEKCIGSVEEAVEFINTHNTKHSECIVTNNRWNARYFQSRVDAACVYVNASTRFTDGGEFGFGAELGISTQKLHARGPMGITALTTTKFLIDGDGQVR